MVDIIKKQAEVFLLDANEFFPFATYIASDNRNVPVGAKFEDDRTPALEVIDLLERGLKDHIQKGECKIGVIAVDVVRKENNVVYDAIELRFFELNKDIYNNYLKYKVMETYVEFFED